MGVGGYSRKLQRKERKRAGFNFARGSSDDAKTEIGTREERRQRKGMRKEKAARGKSVRLG